MFNIGFSFKELQDPMVKLIEKLCHIFLIKQYFK